MEPNRAWQGLRHGVGGLLPTVGGFRFNYICKSQTVFYVHGKSNKCYDDDDQVKDDDVDDNEKEEWRKGEWGMIRCCLS